jgi:hypothetical protein
LFIVSLFAALAVLFISHHITSLNILPRIPAKTHGNTIWMMENLACSAAGQRFSSLASSVTWALTICSKTGSSWFAALFLSVNSTPKAAVVNCACFFKQNHLLL